MTERSEPPERPPERLTVLIVGGYGVFGGRIVQLLEDEPRLTLVVAGRSREKAEAFCRSRDKAKAKLVAAAFDRNGDPAGPLDLYRPGVLVDASGPFQAYGEGRYRIIEACLAKGVNYLDLADGSDFVAGVRQHDAAARAAGLFVLSGVSSFPVLTAAAARRLSVGMARVRAIRGGIAPSPYAGVGENVIRAIAAYAGQRIPLKRRGAEGHAYPLTEKLRFTIAPPGATPLESRLFSLVDVPDLRALPELWPEVETVWMGAAPVPEILHRALIACAWLVRARLAPSLSPLAPLMHLAANHLRWGEHRGGMFVEVEAEDASGARLTGAWHMVAEGDDGPFIPSMAVVAIVRNLLAGRAPSAGARAATGDLELEDYEKLFARRAIRAGVRDENSTAAAGPYPRLLGSSWAQLPLAIRAMHGFERTSSASGRASVERGHGLLSRLAAFIVGFPAAVADTPVSVRFERVNGEETWSRRFGSHAFSSRQFAGSGRWTGLLCERFGPLTFGMALIPDERSLRLVLRRWSVFGMPLPMRLCPYADAYETTEEGRFRFHVEIGHRLTGLIVRYRGWLAVESGKGVGPAASAEALPAA